MSTLPFSSSSPVRRAQPSPSDIVRSLWTEALQTWRTRRAVRAMHGLSDEMLHDIGVARSEIADVTRHGRPVRR